MMHNVINQIGDWNPQLFRELKGRLKVFNVAIAVVISLLCQVILFLYQLRELPGRYYSAEGQYCLVRAEYIEKRQPLNRQLDSLYRLMDNYRSANPPQKSKIGELQSQINQLQDKISDLSSQYCPTNQIDMQMWWREHWEYIFSTLTVVFIFTVLVAGTYLLISNLATEERRGTLNFIRLSPQLETSILTGKILGVPILIYLAVLAAVPLHLFAGRGANIATSHILSFWAVMAACCTLFFSAALLFSLFCRWFSGFQPWLASGAVLFFLLLTMQTIWSGPYVKSSVIWFQFFSPFDMTGYLFPNLFLYRYRWEELEKVQFFYIPVGESFFGLMSLHLLNYGLWIYWLRQGWTRCFRNPNATLFSKGQSYLIVAFTQALLWGFTLQHTQNYFPINYQIAWNFGWFLFFNLVLFFGLLAILSPHRQTVQDWARYRHQNIDSEQSVKKNFLLADLLFGEKSPVLVAMLINLAIFTAPFVIWILLAPALNFNHTHNLDWLINDVGRLSAILGVAMFITLMMIYSTVVQRVLLMKTKQRFIWAIVIVAALFFLPLIALGMLDIRPAQSPIIWLFSSFPWASLEYASAPTVFVAWLGELTVLTLLILHLNKQLRILGESATKAMLAKN
ncbi:ABC transporter permease [Scytonema sp. NUACC21]